MEIDENEELENGQIVDEEDEEEMKKNSLIIFFFDLIAIFMLLKGNCHNRL
jgi:hypothetical protein